MIARFAAIVRRDLRVQLSYPFHLGGQLLAAVFAVVTYFFIGKLVSQPEALEPYGGGYFEFALVGLIVTGFAVVALTAFSQAISGEQRQGTLEILLATATPLPTLMAGSLATPFLVASVQAVLFGVVGWSLADVSIGLGAALAALPLLLLTLLSFCAFGVVSAAVIVLTKRGDVWTAMVLQATNLLAGAVFPVSVLPPFLAALSRLFPAYYGFEGMRAVLLSDEPLTSVLPELAILAGFNAVLFPAALWLLRRALRTARVTGTLGNA